MFTKSNLKRNLQIEGLRGGAIVLIVLFHVYYRFALIYLGMDYLWLSENGRIGVAVFLVITGFYLVDFNSEQDTFSIIRYFGKRFWKLWPCYAAAVTIIAVVVHIFYLPERMSTWGDYLLNLILINGFIDTPYVDGAHWYMTTLITVTVIVGLARKTRVEKNPMFYIGWMILGDIAVMWNIPYLSTLLGDKYIGYIVIAVGLRYFSQKNEWFNARAICWYVAMAVAFGSICFLRGKLVLLELVVICLIFWGCVQRKLPFLQCRVLVWIGGISYPLYLIHQNISFEVEYMLMECNNGWSLLYGIPAMVISVGLALVLMMWDYWIHGFCKNHGFWKGEKRRN